MLKPWHTKQFTNFCKQRLRVPRPGHETATGKSAIRQEMYCTGAQMWHPSGACLLSRLGGRPLRLEKCMGEPGTVPERKGDAWWALPERSGNFTCPTQNPGPSAQSEPRQDPECNRKAGRVVVEKSGSSTGVRARHSETSSALQEASSACTAGSGESPLSKKKIQEIGSHACVAIVLCGCFYLNFLAYTSTNSVFTTCFLRVH